MDIKAARFLTIADNICDYVPIVSTVSSIVNLFIKIVVLPRLDPATVKNNSYFRHLEYKSLRRLVTLCVPILGNIVVGVYDFLHREFNNKSYALKKIKNTSDLEYLVYNQFSKELQDDKEFVLAFVSRQGCRLQDVNPCFRDDEKIVLAAAKSRFNYRVLRDCGPNCRNNEAIVALVVERKGLQLEHASEQIRNTKRVVLLAVGHDSRALQYTSLELQRDPDVIAVYNESRAREEDVRKKERDLVERIRVETGNDVSCLLSLI